MRIFLSKPHMSGRERAYVDQAFESNFIAPLGPQLTAFEQTCADYLQSGSADSDRLHCVGLSSGTAALHLALRLNGVCAGDEVWVSSMTP